MVQVTNIQCRVAIRQLMAFGVLLACLSTTSAVVAQPAAMNYLQPRMERANFQDLCNALDLDPEQRSMFHMLFEDYLEDVTTTASQADAQADTVGRQKILAAMEGRAVLMADQLRDMRLAVLSSYEQNCANRGTQLLEELLQELEMVLMDMQVTKWPRAVRSLRRQVYLHARQADGNLESYAGDGVDICQLLEQSSDIGIDLEADRTLSQIYRDYEQEVDQIIVDAVGRHLLVQIEMEIASIAKDAERLAELEAMVISGWDQLYDLNQRRGQQIAEHFVSLGQADLASRWLEQLKEANFPWLFVQSEPVFVYEWIVREHPEYSTAAQPVMDSYNERMNDLKNRMIVMIINARSDDGIVLQPNMSNRAIDAGRRGELQSAYLRLTGSRSVTDSQALASLMGLLDAEAHASLQRDIRRWRANL